VLRGLLRARTDATPLRSVAYYEQGRWLGRSLALPGRSLALPGRRLALRRKRHKGGVSWKEQGGASRINI